MASGFIPGKSTSFHGPLSSSSHSACPPGNDPVNTCSAYVISERAMSHSRSFPVHPSSKKSLRSLPVALEKAMMSSSSQTDVSAVDKSLHLAGNIRIHGFDLSAASAARSTGGTAATAARRPRAAAAARPQVRRGKRRRKRTWLAVLHPLVAAEVDACLVILFHLLERLLLLLDDELCDADGIHHCASGLVLCEQKKRRARRELRKWRQSWSRNAHINNVGHFFFSEVELHVAGGIKGDGVVRL